MRLDTALLRVCQSHSQATHCSLGMKLYMPVFSKYTKKSEHNHTCNIVYSTFSFYVCKNQTYCLSWVRNDDISLCSFDCKVHESLEEIQKTSMNKFSFIIDGPPFQAVLFTDYDSRLIPSCLVHRLPTPASFPAVLFTDYQDIEGLQCFHLPIFTRPPQNVLEACSD